MNKNKFGVVYHAYTLKLADGSTKYVDIGNEDDWGNIQQMNPDDTFKDGHTPDDWFARVGFGNDADGHIEIVEVMDNETCENVNVKEWGKYVWSFVDNYSC